MKEHDSKFPLFVHLGIIIIYILMILFYI